MYFLASGGIEGRQDSEADEDIAAIRVALFCTMRVRTFASPTSCGKNPPYPRATDGSFQSKPCRSD